MSRAVGYARVSTRDQGLSIEAQAEAIRHYCDLEGLELVAVYKEQGVSGGVHLASRPQGARALHQLKQDGISNLVVIKLDRLYRSALDALQQTEQLDKQGVAVHFLDLKVDTSTPMGRMMLSMMASFAEMERSLIRERTKAALQHKKKNRQAYTHTPYGWDDVGGKLLENKDEQAGIATMREMRMAGASYRAICKALEEGEIPTKKGGKTWSPATVRYILKNELNEVTP